ncbi:MAG TPA: glycosyltransferase, partial [Gaiellaceae bacterium]|nr:glycosyltransferase [Gaiellaceae bacterium]
MATRSQLDLRRETLRPLGAPTGRSSDEPTSVPRRISVVVPLLDEEATVAALYEQVRAALDPTSLAWELVYVDDGSTDDSYRALVRLHAAHTNVKVVRLRRNFGKAAALRAGFDVA